MDRGLTVPRERDIALVSERAWGAQLPRDYHHSEAIAEASGTHKTQSPN